MGKYVCVFTTEIYNFLHIVAPWGGDTTEKISELLWKVVFFCFVLFLLISHCNTCKKCQLSRSDTIGIMPDFNEYKYKQI